MKTYGEMEVRLHTFLTSVLDGGEWSASLPGRFTHGGVTVTHCIGGWMGSRTCLDAVENRRISTLAGNRIPVVQPVV